MRSFGLEKPDMRLFTPRKAAYELLGREMSANIFRIRKSEKTGAFQVRSFGLKKPDMRLFTP